MEELGYTPFSIVYDSFLSKITDDMYMELTPEDTEKILQELLLSAIHYFEFPKQSLEYKEITEEDEEDLPFTTPYFINKLTPQEINILATYMVVQWLGQQLATVENTRMKYSGSDFKFTSQANHMQKILQQKKHYQERGFHLQRLYKRRQLDDNGVYKTTMDSIMQYQPKGGTGVWGKWF